MQYAEYLRPPFEPARDGERGFLMARKSYAHCAQPAKREIDIVGTGTEAHFVYSVAQLRPGRLIGGRGAEHQFGMAGNIFLAGLDCDVDPLFERPKVQGTGPGIVDQDDSSPAVGRRSDRRNVLHLEAQ